MEHLLMSQNKEIQPKIKVNLNNGFFQADELESLIMGRNEVIDEGFRFPAHLKILNNKINYILSQGEPLFNEVRDALVERFIGDFYKYMTAENRVFFVNTETYNRGVRLITSRIKDIDSLSRKINEIESLDLKADEEKGTKRRLVYEPLTKSYQYDLTDGYGIAMIGQTWSVIDNVVKPYLNDHYHVFSSKSYRNEERKKSGYEAEHLLIQYPLTGLRESIIIDVHLHCLNAFKEAEFGRAAKPRSLEKYKNIHQKLMSYLH